MKLVLQPKGSSLCGQCCIAMLMDISLEEAIKLVGHNGITSDRDLLTVLETKYPGISDRKFFNIGTRVNNIYLNKHRNPNNSNIEHWTISNLDILLDPSGRDSSELWPIFKYWIVKHE